MYKNSHKKRQRILVTVGAGYIGSMFIRDALKSGYNVRCLDLLIYGDKALRTILKHPRFEFEKGDIRDRHLVKKVLHGVDSVVHLAAIVGDLPCRAAPKSTVEINFKGTQLLAHYAKELGINRLVFASTCSNYGVMNSDTAVEETSELNPVSLYAETKIDAETFLSSISSPDFSVTILRFASAYGISYRTRFDLLINSLTYEAWKNNEITVFAANTWRPYIHISDMSLILKTVLEAPLKNVCGQIFNAGSNEQNLTKEMLIKILQKNLPTLKIRLVNTIDDRRNYFVNFDKLKKMVGFKPRKSIEDGIREILDSFNKGLLTKEDFEVNKLETLENFFKEKEDSLKNEISLLS